MVFFIILLGIGVGFSLASLVTAFLVSRSNDIGNSKGTFNDFTKKPLKIIQSKNRIRRPIL